MHIEHASNLLETSSDQTTILVPLVEDEEGCFPVTCGEFLPLCRWGHLGGEIQNPVMDLAI